MRLLIVEDNVRLATLMGKLLAENGQVADIAASIDEAHAALALVEYDIVLLDLSLPDGDGRDILGAIRKSQNNAYVLIVTARSDVVERVRMLNAGADDYIVKPFQDDELIARVRALSRRPQTLREKILVLGNIRLDTESLSLSIGGNQIAIPRRELSVLSALLSQHGRVLARERLDSAVYSLDAEVSDNAVEAVVSRLRRRLETAGATVDIIAMRGIGYLLKERNAC